MDNSPVFGSGDCPNTPPVLVGLEVHPELRFNDAKNSSRHRLPSHWARGSDLALTNLEDPLM